MANESYYSLLWLCLRARVLDDYRSRSHRRMWAIPHWLCFCAHVLDVYRSRSHRRICVGPIEFHTGGRALTLKSGTANTRSWLVKYFVMIKVCCKGGGGDLRPPGWTNAFWSKNNWKELGSCTVNYSKSPMLLDVKILFAYAGLWHQDVKCSIINILEVEFGKLWLRDGTNKWPGHGNQNLV